MSSNIALKFTQRLRNYVAGIGSYVFARAICLGLLILTATSVQAMTKFSEEWIDDSNPSSGYVVGCGVTRTEYYEDYHLISVKTTLTSPNGRTEIEYGFADGAGYKQPYIARAEASLVIDFNDLGNYIVESHHTSSCPVEDFGFSSIDIGIAIAITNYIYNGLEGGSCRYDLFCPNGNASATCPANNPVYVTPSQNVCRNYLHDFRLKTTIRGRIVCFPVGKAELAGFPVNCS